MERIPYQPDPRQALLFAHLEASEDAYAQAIRDCGLPPLAERLALWIHEHGERRLVDTDRCQVVQLPGQRKLAGLLGCSPGSISRASLTLEEAGLLWRSAPVAQRSASPRSAAQRSAARSAALNLSRCIELAEAGSTGQGDDAIAFGRGRPAEVASEQPTEPEERGVMRGAALALRGAARPSKSKNKNINNPSNQVQTKSSLESSYPSDSAESPPAAASGPEPSPPADAERPGQRRANHSALARTAAWQALQPGDFRDGRLPSREKLRAAFRAARDAGVVDAGRESAEKFLATVRHCSRTAKSPCGALATRVASGTLHWAEWEDYEWAKRVLQGAEATTNHPGTELAGQVAEQLRV